MTLRVAAFLMLLLTAGCGANAPLALSLSGASPSPAPDVFACARGQLKALEFDQTSIDLQEYRLNGKKYDETVRRPDVNFRRVVDRLEIEASPGTEGAVTALRVTARTFGEFTTQRGPTEEQERTSEVARAAAETIMRQCGQQVAAPQGQS